jgi:mannose-1-phosphate guanylyltransferase
MLDARDCLIGANEVLTAVVGVKNMMAVARRDAVVVVPHELPRRSRI